MPQPDTRPRDFDPTLPLPDPIRETLPPNGLLADGSLASPAPNQRCPIYALGCVENGVPVLYHTAYHGPDSFIAFKDKEAAELMRRRFAAGEKYAVVEVC